MMNEAIREFTAELGKLRGTSPEKINQLVRQVRGDGKSSAVIAVMERVPVVGPIVKFLVYDLGEMPADHLDDVLSNAAQLIEGLRSDTLEIEAGE
jgi:hypothetical protein